VIPTYLVLSLLSRQRFYLIAGLIIALALSPLIIPRVAEERIKFTFEQREHAEQISLGNLRLDTSTSARIRSWQDGLQAWQKRPILGYGVTGHGFMDAQYPRILTETGILGFLAFAWLIYALFQVGLYNWRNEHDNLIQGLSVGLLAGLVGLLVHAIGANTFIIVRIMEPFWFATGIVIALSSIDEESRHATAS